MGWTTMQTNEFVEGLIERKLVHPESIVRGGGRYRPAWIWTKGEKT
jgi:hypothetical protein